MCSSQWDIKYCVKWFYFERLTAHSLRFSSSYSASDLFDLEFLGLCRPTLWVLYFPKEPINVIGVLTVQWETENALDRVLYVQVHVCLLRDRAPGLPKTSCQSLKWLIENEVQHSLIQSALLEIYTEIWKTAFSHEVISPTLKPKARHTGISSSLFIHMMTDSRRAC